MHARLASLALVLTLSACFGYEHIEELRLAAPAPTAFEQELARHYLRFSEEEAEKYDWQSAGHFAHKGLQAAAGQFAAPEDPEAWGVPEHALDELRSARASVVAKLTPSFRAANPSEAALLLFSYDCWVEEQEEAWEIAAIERCRQGVMRHMQETDVPIASGGPLSTSYLFHFAQQDTSLEGMAEDELRVIADTLASEAYPYQVIINGHAERGREETVALSLLRADYIRDFLVRNGLNAKYIAYNAYGEVQQDKPHNGVQRVEIFME